MAREVYAGIGSRETPDNILMMMQFISSFLCEKGYLLRSGGAKGADNAFESGALVKTIFYTNKYRHWGVREPDATSMLSHYDEDVWDKAYEIAKKFYHSNLAYRPRYVQELMTRNVFQVLGPRLDSHSEFVICWTKDGKASGGTGQALRIAKDYEIPIYNMKNEKDMFKLKEFLLSL